MVPPVVGTGRPVAGVSLPTEVTCRPGGVAGHPVDLTCRPGAVVGRPAAFTGKSAPRAARAGRVAAAVAVLVVALAVAPATTEGLAAAAPDAGGSSFDAPEGLLFVDHSDDARITGWSTWAPGSELTVVLRSSDAPTPFVRRARAEVGSYGRWAVTVNLSAVAVGQRFTATVGRGDRVEDTVRGKVGFPPAAVVFPDQRARTGPTTVTVRSADLSLGGFVAIHEDEPAGPIIGVSRYLPPGNHRDVVVRLHERPTGDATLVAMAHRDTDGDGTFDFVASGDDGPYLAADTDPNRPVMDEATVRFGQLPTATFWPGRADSPTATPAGDPTTADPTPGTGDPGATGGSPDGMKGTSPTATPGFGLAAAAVALVLVGLWAARRG